MSAGEIQEKDGIVEYRAVFSFIIGVNERIKGLSFDKNDSPFT